MKDRLLAARLKVGYSQRQLAKAIDISPSSIALFERGARNPSKRTLKVISEVCGVSLNWLLTGEGEMTETSLAEYADPDSTIAILGREYNLTPEAEELIRQFVKLPPDGQSAVVGYVSNVAEGLMSISESRSDSVVALPTAESEREARRSALHSALDSELDSEEEALLETSSASMLA